jgi:hypothetical protein
VAELRWAGHLQRIRNNEIARRIMDFRLEGRRTVRRHKLRWMGGIVEDLEEARDPEVVDSQQGQSRGRKFNGKPRLVMMVMMMMMMTTTMIMRTTMMMVMMTIMMTTTTTTITSILRKQCVENLIHVSNCIFLNVYV